MRFDGILQPIENRSGTFRARGQGVPLDLLILPVQSGQSRREARHPVLILLESKIPAHRGQTGEVRIDDFPVLLRFLTGVPRPFHVSKRDRQNR